MLGLYVLGFVAAVVTARLLKSSILKSGRTPFLLEMPSYRWPTVQSLGLRLLDRAKVFLRRAGTIILLVTRDPVGGRRTCPTPTARPPPIEQSLAGTIGPHHRTGHQAAGLQLEDRHRPDHRAGRARDHHRHAGQRSTAWTRNRRQLDLQKALQHDLTPGGAVALLIFFAFAMQCISTIAVVRRETGGWKWPVLQFTYMSVLAYVSAFAAFHLLS